MKRIILTVIILLIVAGLVACANPLEAAVSQLAEESEASSSVDDGSSDSGDAQMDIDVDEDGGSIEISGDDGNITIEGSEDGMPWPGDKLPSSVPEISGVTVVMVMDMDGGVLVGFENFDEAAAAAYVTQLKGMGWESVMEYTDDESYSSILSNGDETLQIGWSSEDNAGTLTYMAE